MFGIVLFILLIILILIVLVTNIKIVAQSYAYVVERLGSYKTTWETGLHLKVPFIEEMCIRDRENMFIIGVKR